MVALGVPRWRAQVRIAVPFDDPNMQGVELRLPHIEEAARRDFVLRCCEAFKLLEILSVVERIK